jgi:hypothetical protein
MRSHTTPLVNCLLCQLETVPNLKRTLLWIQVSLALQIASESRRGVLLRSGLLVNLLFNRQEGKGLPRSNRASSALSRTTGVCGSEVLHGRSTGNKS